jgi:toxin ParE1/3/4
VDLRLFFTEKALSDLSEIVRYIAADDPETASRFGEALLDHVDLLKQFPRMGNIVRRRSQIRKLVHSPVIVYYQFQQDRQLIEVLHFWHGSRRPPKL